MKGRKTYPFKALKGTERKNQTNHEAPTPESAVPCAPAHISARAAEWFGRITSRLEAMGCASASHTEMLALLARRLAEIEHYDELIEQHGAVYEVATKEGSVLKGNPAVRMKSDAMRHAHSLLVEFGLSLAAISKVKVPEKKQDSAWKDFGTE